MSSTTMDPSFGTAGVASFAIGPQAAVTAVALQSDGKVLAAGGYTLVDGSHAFISRLSANGTVDATFGTAGTTLFDTGVSEGFTTVQTDPNGGIVASGNISGELLIARFTDNGALDTSFGSGHGYIPLAGGTDGFTLSGSSLYIINGDALSRYNASTGALDTSFANPSISISGVTPLKSFVGTSILVAPDGKLLISGKADTDTILQPGDEDYTPYSNSGWVVRLNVDGTIDNSFDDNGVQVINDPNLETDNGSGGGFLALDAQQNIYVACTQADRVGEDELTKLDGVDGHQIWQQTWAFSNDQESILNGLGIDGAGEITVGRGLGTFHRYTADGALNKSFGDNGEYTITSQTLSDGFTVANDGNIFSAMGGDPQITDNAQVGKVFATSLPELVHITSKGTLVIDGSAIDDSYSIRRKDNTVRVVSTAADGSQEQVIYNWKSVKRMYVELLDGDDVLTTTASITQPMTVFGGNGNDTLTTGSGDDLIDGGAGNDSLDGSLGADRIYGIDGNDTLIGGAGRDRLYGGAGTDQFYGGSSSNFIYADGDSTADTIHISGKQADVIYKDDIDVVIRA